MIEFKKKIAQLLPYDREQYLDFLDDDSDSYSKWLGVSFQLYSNEREVGLERFIEYYLPLFNLFVANFHKNNTWILSHDDKDLKWFPNEEENLTEFRALFIKNKIPFSFKGGLVFEKEDLLNYSRNIISYPFSVFNEEGMLYKNLDVSHSKLPLIMKISGHWNIDFLSTDRDLLRQVVNHCTSEFFIVKQYNGTLIM